MKKTLPFLLIIGALAFGCSKSETSTPASPVETALSKSAVQKALVTDFTATWCGPCGAYGMPQMSDLKSKYSESAVLMAIHGTGNDPLTNSKGTAYVSSLGISSFPTIQLQMKDEIYSPNPANYNVVYGKIEALNAEAPRVGINIAHVIDQNAQTITLKSRFTSLSDLSSEKFGVAMYVMEDNIMSFQNGTNEGASFIHEDVMRTNSGSTWGTVVTGDKLKANVASDFEFKISLNPNWDPAHLYAVAVVYKLNGSNTLESVVNCNKSEIAQ
jgi:thiol-disulfide isomerase/thioredoxin